MADKLAPREPFNRLRWGRALFAASMTAWATIVLVLLVVSAWGADPEEGRRMAASLVFFIMFGIPLALIVGFIVGLPALFLANRLDLSRWWQAPLVGGTAGALATTIWLAAMGFDGPWLPAIVTCGVAGALSGFVAWQFLGLNRKTP